MKPRSAVTKSAGIVMPAATAPVAAPTAISTTVSQMLRTPSIAFCAQIADFRNQFKWLTANSNQPRPRILPRPSPWRSYSPSKGPTRLQCFQWVVMTQVHFGHLARSLGPRGGNGCENPRIWLQTTCAPAAPRTDALATSSWTPLPDEGSAPPRRPPRAGRPTAPRPRGKMAAVPSALMDSSFAKFSSLNRSWHLSAYLSCRNALLQNSSLAAECFSNHARDRFDARCAPHVLMHDLPHDASCRRFVRPNTDQIRQGIAKKASSVDDAHIARRGPNLDERVVAAKHDPRTVVPAGS